MYGFIQQNPPNLFELYIYLKYLSKILYEVDRNDSMAQIEIYPDGSEKDATPSRTYIPADVSCQVRKKFSEASSSQQVE